MSFAEAEGPLIAATAALPREVEVTAVKPKATAGKKVSAKKSTPKKLASAAQKSGGSCVDEFRAPFAHPAFWAAYAVFGNLRDDGISREHAHAVPNALLKDRA
ncbi:hypothetical protein [Paraburkholderia hiiakae]|uniref:hypothetical protein n=1 Tax=Paraburkholderia hiiakae TaxID=1081782 RepID=UPI00191B6C0E|nr:hypothetical protein [Paraburkholderia hiiakae]